MKWWHYLSLASLTTALLIGIPLGVGLSTFTYGKASSYLSNDPKSCRNCHVMNEQYESWERSGHRHVAVCNDCHAPHNLLGKYFTKAYNGYHHSVAFTKDEYQWPIRIKPFNKKIVENSCLHCHAQITSEMNITDKHKNAGDCLHCHQKVGHAL